MYTLLFSDVRFVKRAAEKQQLREEKQREKGNGTNKGADRVAGVNGAAGRAGEGELTAPGPPSVKAGGAGVGR